MQRQQQRPEQSNEETETIKHRWIHNRSSRGLSDTERSTLEKGLTFAVTPTAVKVADFVAPIEAAISKLPVQDGQFVRHRINSVLEKASLPAGNLTKQEKMAIASLTDDPAIVILPADKGNATVVLDSAEYKRLVDEHLQSGPYTEVPRDRSNTTANAVTKWLRRHKADFPPAEYSRLLPSNWRTPRFFGLPKIHKPDLKLRPIVSSIASPISELVKWLTKILHPLTGNSASFVKDTPDFVRQIQRIQLVADETILSFDVTSLFTYVPVGPALEVIRRRLEADTKLHERTTIPFEDIMEALTICAKGTCFQYDGKFYVQNDGMPMGLSCSPAVCCIYMDDWEQKYLPGAPAGIRTWLRVVDDTFVVCQKDKVDDLLAYINDRDQNIQFTRELCSEEGTLPFLDTLVRVQDDGQLTTDVYRKPTHTDQYVQFQSNHPLSVKAGVIGCLQRRAAAVTTTEDAEQQEMSHLTAAFQANGYPKRFIARQLRRRKFGPAAKKEAPMAWATIPYIRGISETIGRICNDYNIKVTYTSRKQTIGSRLVHVKDRLGLEQQSDVVYSIPCAGCPATYIGQTSRRLATRIKEHQTACEKRQADKSATAAHTLRTGHTMDFGNVKIVDRAPNAMELLVREAIAVKASPNAINGNDGLELNTQWTALRRQNIR